MKLAPLRLPMQYFAEGDPTPKQETPAQEPPAQQPAPATTGVDMDSITAAAEKKAQDTVQAMLKKQGLDDESIGKIVEEWKGKQKTPDQVLQEKDQAISGLQAEKTDLERQLLATGKGIPAKLAPKYIRLAETYLEEGGDFGKALDDAVKDFPVPRGEGIPELVLPAGNQPPPAKGWKEMTLTEQGKLFASDPATAKALAAKAGIHLE